MIEVPFPVGGLYQPGPNPASLEEAQGKCLALQNFDVRGRTFLQSVGYASALTVSDRLVGMEPYTDSQGRPCIMFLVYSGGAVQVRYYNAISGATATVISDILATTIQISRYHMVRFLKYMFIATPDNGLWYVDISGSAPGSYGKCGVAPPATTCTAALGAAGNLTGDYSYKVTYVNALGHEGNASAVSNTISTSADQVSLTAIPTSTGMTRKLYRTISGGAGKWFHLATLNTTDTT